MNSVQVVGQGTNVGQVNSGGVTRNVWNFSVVVNGNAGVATVYALPSVSYDDIVNYLVNELEQGDIDIGGIAILDPGDDRGDGPGDDRGDDDDDSAVASGGSDGNEYGDSV